MKPKIFLTLLTLLAFLTTRAQKLSKEATYEISKKANKGYMYEPAVDETKNQLSLTFVTKATNRTAKFETYNFDLDFNFKGMTESEVPMEKVKGYKADKGDEYEVEGVTVEQNLVGTLILKRKIYKYKWNWFWGGYDRKTSFGEKIKPKTEDGGKLSHVTHVEQPNGDIMIVAGNKGTGMGNVLSMTTEFHIVRFDHTLTQLSDNVLKFDYPQIAVSASSDDDDEDDDDENDNQKDLLVVFAPMEIKGAKKSADPDATNYTFVRIGADGTVKERVPFKSKTGVFNGDMIVESGSDIYILGATGEKDDQYFNEKFAAPLGMRDDEIEKFKAKGFQVVKISNGKAVYATITTLDDFENKAQAPPGQKKKPEYTGRKFKVATIKLMPNGDILLAGQKYTKAKNGGHTVKFGGFGSLGGGGNNGGPTYGDIIMMHFGNEGSLKAAYGVRREENSKDANVSPNNQMIWPGPDGKIYWCIMEMNGWREEKELGESKYKYLMYPSVAAVDILNAKIGEFVQFGQGKTDYFVNNKYPIMTLKGNTELFFLGETKSGKTLWFGKMPLN